MTNSFSAYLHPHYADAFAAHGIPRQLPLSGAWLLQREIAGGGFDAMGLYPILMCSEWSAMRHDLEALKDIVCVSAVVDPFAEIDTSELAECFPHLMRHFKDHYVADLSYAPEEYVGAQHLRYARRALKSVDVHESPAVELDAEIFAGLYGRLIARHAVKGMASFSRESLAAQLSVPGATAFYALVNGTCVGASIWYAYEDRAYYHLAAYDEVGYALRASYALFWRAIEHFTHRVRWLNFGGGAGTSVTEADGLTQFKRGWANTVRPAYLCGRIVDEVRYAEICEAAGFDASDLSYFPAYRRGEWD
jgi:hypothetical protein